MTRQSKIFSLFCLLILLGTHLPLDANPPFRVLFSDRERMEKPDGSMKETAPFVTVDGVALRAFAHMQRLNLVKKLQAGTTDYPETLYIFRVWQGGVGQNEQVMLLSLANEGILVLGPHKAQFEEIKIRKDKDRVALDLFLNDDQKPTKTLYYFDGVISE